MAITTIEYQTDRLSKNVQEQFLNLTAEQIKEATANGRSGLVNICMNLTSDFNKSSVIRASNAFLCRETYLVGSKKYDRRGTVGMHHFEVIKHADTLTEVIDHLHSEGYTVYAVDNTPSLNPQVVYDVELPEQAAFVYGEEQAGLSDEDVALCDASLYIPQRGVARSLNVAQAAAVMMSEYSRQHRS
jgi:tRNA G18 (ribose-2'-O)-methylase SpoU